jgi:hypothetical protein
MSSSVPTLTRSQFSILGFLNQRTRMPRSRRPLKRTSPGIAGCETKRKLAFEGPREAEAL